MASIPQIRNRLLEGFPEKQADLLAHVVIEAHDDLVNQADFHALTGVVKELADSQKDLAEAQRRTEERVEELADAQRQTEKRVEELTEAQKRTEGTLTDVVKTQQKMLIRLDRLDGHMLEDKVAKNLPAFLGREFRRCRVLDRTEFVEGLEGRLPEAELADLMRADVIAVARRGEESVHLVVEVPCTADADDLARAVRRAAALASAGYVAIGIVACESISPQTLDAARTHGLRVLTNGWLLPEAA
ncbi:MAG: hypothetical protein ACKO40_01960 [Planctomycetaceae bacterium]